MVRLIAASYVQDRVALHLSPDRGMRCTNAGVITSARSSAQPLNLQGDRHEDRKQVEDEKGRPRTQELENQRSRQEERRATPLLPVLPVLLSSEVPSDKRGLSNHGSMREAPFPFAIRLTICAGASIRALRSLSHPLSRRLATACIELPMIASREAVAFTLSSHRAITSITAFRTRLLNLQIERSCKELLEAINHRLQQTCDS